MFFRSLAAFLSVLFIAGSATLVAGKKGYSKCSRKCSVAVAKCQKKCRSTYISPNLVQQCKNKCAATREVCEGSCTRVDKCYGEYRVCLKSGQPKAKCRSNLNKCKSNL
jgi:hypothetical protein